MTQAEAFELDLKPIAGLAAYREAALAAARVLLVLVGGLQLAGSPPLGIA